MSYYMEYFHHVTNIFTEVYMSNAKYRKQKNYMTLTNFVLLIVVCVVYFYGTVVLPSQTNVPNGMYAPSIFVDDAEVPVDGYPLLVVNEQHFFSVNFAQNMFTDFNVSSDDSGFTIIRDGETIDYNQEGSEVKINGIDENYSFTTLPIYDNSNWYISTADIPFFFDCEYSLTKESGNLIFRFTTE